MWPFKQYPYTNYQELNLDYLISEMKALRSSVDDFIGNVDTTINDKATEAVDAAMDAYDIDEKVQERIDALTLALSGKHVNVWGDSLSLENRWPSYLSAAGATHNNFSTSGYWLADRSGQTGMATRIIGSNGSDSDSLINVLAIGTNDWRNQVTLGAAGNGDRTTVFGAMTEACDALITKYPNAINVFCLPPRCGSSAVTAVYSQQFMNRGLANIAKQYGLVIVDLFNGLPNFNPTNETLRQKWSTDYIHPNANYIATWAAYVIEHLANCVSDALPTNYGGCAFTPTLALSGATVAQSRWTQAVENCVQVNMQFNNLPVRPTLTVQLSTNIPAMLQPYTNTILPAMVRYTGETINKPVICYLFNGVLYATFDKVDAVDNMWISGMYQLRDYPRSN